MKPQIIIWIAVIGIGLLSTAESIIAQTKIQTVDGSIYEGGIVSDTGNTVVLITDENKEVRILKSQVAIQEHEAITGLHFKNSFPLFGASLGTPAGLQFIGGYYFGPFGMRMSGGYLERIYGAQLNIFRNIYRGRSFSHNIGIAAGFLEIDASPYVVTQYYESYSNDYYSHDYREWLYGAIEYDINLSGFFSSIGLSFGSGDFTTPQLLFQIGYVHEFK